MSSLTEKMPPLVKDANRFVAHIDILGVRQLSLTKPERAFDALRILSDATDRVLAWGIEIVSTGEHIGDQIEHMIFSDTVVLVTRGDTSLDLYAIVLLSTELFYASLSRGVPVRAGVAHGRLLSDPKRGLFAGPALVNAHSLGEEAQWLGVVVDRETAERACAVPLKAASGKPMIVDYNVPLKSGGPRHRAVADWVESHPNAFHAHLPLPTSGREVYHAFEASFDQYEMLPFDVRLKYQNTAEFINRPRPD